MSRWDRMIVAWQFIARNRSNNRPVPLGYGVMRAEIGLHPRQRRECLLQTDHTVPYGTGHRFACIPGNKLPGYDRSVPPGQIFFLGKGPLCNDPNASASPHLAREFPARVHYFI
jgi:hypothetical protein